MLKTQNHIVLTIVSVGFIAVFSSTIYAQERIYRTQKNNPTQIVIDGSIDEAGWDNVEWEGNFTQREPYEGEAPSQTTEFKILYDDNNLYIAVRANDTEPDKIEKRLTRRDAFEGDLISVNIDSYNDKLTAFEFAVNAAGVKNDGIISNDSDMDETWNPVWYVKTSTYDSGWIAEMKIPYTQLRFPQRENYVWGLQVFRWLFRKEESSAWVHIPKEDSRWVSLFGELQGIHNIKPKKEVELIPYAMGNIETYEPEEDNPFANGQNLGYSFGVDGKVAVTNDLTLNFAVNPDFGQVEADPSEVNLTAFETFFEEKRPFFIEGSNIYNYKITSGDGPVSMDNLFYSRRIGRRPQLEPEICDNEYMDLPESTRILGAFKLSGKTKKGWSIGILESVTNEEKALIDSEGEQKEVVVEPLTNYFNTRIQKDINKGNTTVGGMVTATNRKVYDSEIDSLHHSAYTGGLDYTNYWKGKNYYFHINSVFSHVVGDKKAITVLQESPRRYYQRPDAGHLHVDSNLTSLTGNGGSIEGGKIGGGHWRYGGWLTWRTPGLELNDMGYLRQADVIMQMLWAGYRIWEPFSIFRRVNINFNQWSRWDFSGARTFLGGNVSFNTQLKNYWSLGSGVSRSSSNINRSELRGGPSIRYPGDLNNWVFILSDERKKVVGEVFLFNNWGDLNHSRVFDVSLKLTYRPINALALSIEPGYLNKRRDIQYVETVDYNEDDRYIISTLNSERFSADFRINLSITPDLSFQYWGQPFIFAGNYSSFKKITDPMSDNYSDRFYVFDESEISYDSEGEIYNIDENGDGNTDYSIDNPNFNFFEFRSNFVARWEYIPGSTIYFVWSQGRCGDNTEGDFNFKDDVNELYSIPPRNVFLIKVSFRLSI